MDSIPDLLLIYIVNIIWIHDYTINETKMFVIMMIYFNDWNLIFLILNSDWWLC